MNKIKYLLFTILISSIMIPTVLAKENVEIKSIDLVNKSENATVNALPTFNGLEMNYDVSFASPTDYVKYKVVVKNDTDTTYRISEDTSFNTSNYIDYKYEVSGDLKGKSETTVFVTITYSKAVDSSQLVNNKYTETNKAIVQLLNEKDNVVNPETGRSTISIVILMLFIFSTTYLYLKIRKKNVLVLFILICIIPICVFAIETLKLTINVNVTIENNEVVKPKYKVGYLILFDNLYTDSELAKVDQTSTTTCKTIYIGEINEINKYNLCNNVIYHEDETYAAGEQVQLKTFNERYIYISECSLQGDIYVCPEDVTIYNNETIRWFYDSGWDSFGYTYLADDKDTMNFTNYIYDEWNFAEWGSGRFGVFSPQTFTMPSHDVLFAQDDTGSD